MSDRTPLVDVLLAQREAWKRGERPGVEDFLRQHAHLAGDDNAVLDLIYNEVMLREAAGQRPELAEYLRRFPRLEADLRAQFEVDQALTLEELADPTASAGAGSSPRNGQDWLDGCELLEEVGRGAMGTVWRAWQRGARRLVAVKLLSSDVPAARVRTEVEAATRLSHPNIVQVYEVRQDGERTALVMEYVEGGNLAQRLVGRPQPPREAARLVETLAWAMAHAHGRGVVHRDLKPSNVLLSGDDGPLGQLQPRISDFGLAKLTEGGMHLTRTSDVLGTPSYMAPEQTGGKVPVGPAADVYALGAILYECLTGRPPFLGETVLDTLDQVRNQEPVAALRLQPRIPRDLEVICLKCLHKSPPRRYGSAKELAEDLRRFQTGEAIRGRPVGPPERAWKWARRQPALAALLVVSLLAGLGFVAGGLAYTQALRRQRDLAQVQRDQAQVQADERARDLYTRQLLSVGLVWPSDPQQGLHMLEDPRACPPDLRCFTWGVLYAQCKRYRSSLPGHRAAITAVAASPDGRHFATGSADGQVRLSALAMGETVAVLHEHTAPVAALAFTSDGRLLATGAHDGMIKLWQLPGGKKHETLRLQTGRVTGLAFHPDRRTLVSVSVEGDGPGTIRLWNTHKRSIRRTLSAEPDALSGIALSPDGNTLACADRDHLIGLWDMRTGRRHGLLRGHTAAVTALVFTARGRLVTGGVDGNLRLWDHAREAELDSANVDVGAIAALAVHPDGQSVAVAADRSTEPGGSEGRPDLRIWDLLARTSEPLRAHGGAASGVAFSRDGRTLISGGADRTVKLWDHPGRRERVAMRDQVGAPGSVALSGDGRTLAWARTPLPGGAGNLIDVYDLERGTMLSVPRGHGRPVRCLCLSADGRTLASASGHDSEPAELLVWESATGRLKRALSGHAGAVTALTASPSGQALASASLDGSVRLWDLDTGKQQLHVDGKGTPWRTLAWSGDGKVLAGGGGVPGRPGVIHVWNAETGRLLHRLEVPVPVACLVVSPDGARLAWSGASGVVRLLEAKAGGEGTALDTGMKAVAWLALSRDGRTLAVAGSGMGVELWDVASAQKRASLGSYRGGACYAAFAADGSMLLTAGVRGEARLWHCFGR